MTLWNPDWLPEQPRPAPSETASMVLDLDGQHVLVVHPREYSDRDDAYVVDRTTGEVLRVIGTVILDPEQCRTVLPALVERAREVAAQAPAAQTATPRCQVCGHMIYQPSGQPWRHMDTEHDVHRAVPAAGL